MNAAIAEPARMIAVDWGTTGVRAAVLGTSGAVLRQWSGSMGLTKVSPGSHSTALRQLLGPHSALLQSLPVYLCGAVGSREGWREVAYVNCPAGLAALAGGIAQIREDGMRLRFIPGLRCEPDRPRWFGEVMRGEETQVIGAIEGEGEQIVITPGAQSKWVRVREGAIKSFHTFVTGDLFAAIGQYTGLARSISRRKADAASASECFEAGVRVGASIPSLAELVFQAYIGDFFKSGHFDAASYLSGVLIGNELVQGCERVQSGADTPLVLIGQQDLTIRYLHACKVLGIHAKPGAEHAVFQGCRRLARARAEV